MPQNDFLSKLNNAIIGVWDNPDFTIAFNSDGINDGIVTIQNKYNKSDYGANYRIVVKEEMPYLQLITKGEGLKSFQEFVISSLDPYSEKKLILTTEFGITLTMNKVD